MNYKYKIYGITIESEIKLSELTLDKYDDPDVFIRIGDIPSNVVKPKSKGLLFQASDDDFILHIDNICSYRVQNGRLITLSPHPGINIMEIKLFLYGSVFAGLLHQRKIFPIHGSAVVSNKKATILSGISSAGKSSLAYGLKKRGYFILSDDVSVLNKTATGEILVNPGIPYLKIWTDVAQAYGQDTNLKSVRKDLNKFLIPMGNSFIDQPTILEQIVILKPTNNNTFRLNKISGANKFKLVQENTYRYQYLLGLERLSEHFEFVTNLVKKIDVYELERPMKPLHVKELAVFFEDNLIHPSQK